MWAQCITLGLFIMPIQEFGQEPSEGLISEESDKQIVPEPQVSGIKFPNIPLAEDEQLELVTRKCEPFKQEAQRVGKKKRETMRQCLGYLRGDFSRDGDILPYFGDERAEKDAKTGRPQLFMPLSRQIFKQIKAQMRLTLFPNDEDYFRVRAKNEEAAQLEDELTEGLKFVFKEMCLTHKLGRFIDYGIVTGNMVAMPYIQDGKRWQWDLITEMEEQPVIDPLSGQPVIDPATGMPATQEVPKIDEYGQKVQGYELREIDDPPYPDLDIWDPQNFYPDPYARNHYDYKWFYHCNRKLQEILDSNEYFNKERLVEEIRMRSDDQVDGAPDLLGHLPLEGYSGNVSFEDIEGNLRIDYYYFPFVKVGGKEFRSVLVEVAECKHIIKFRPNLYPRAINPVVYAQYSCDPDQVDGTGPIEDIMELQRCINLLKNYELDTLARIGNRWAVSENVDDTAFWGAGGGLLRCQDVRQDIMNLSGNYGEMAFIENEIGVLKAEAQITAGANSPFQGSSNIDFKKTATEIQTLAEGAMTIVREAVENVALTGVRENLERVMYLVADLWDKPVKIRVDDPLQGPTYPEIDFRVLRSGDYYIEVVSANPGQSKQAQNEHLEKLLETIVQLGDPAVVEILRPLLKKMATNIGMKDFDNLMDEMFAKVALNGQGNPAVPEGQAGPGSGNIPPVGGVPQPTA